MSLSPGQAAILRALGEGRGSVIGEDFPVGWTLYSENPVIDPPPITFDDVSALHTGDYLIRVFTPVGYIYLPNREALRALEQEAGG